MRPHVTALVLGASLRVSIILPTVHKVGIILSFLQTRTLSLRRANANPKAAQAVSHEFKIWTQVV